MAGPQKSVLFVCLGNICRSPIAEAVFREEVVFRGVDEQWTIDSCGIGPWHRGEKPDSRARECLKRHKLITHHRGRQLEKADFSKFQYILGMDENNLQDIKKKMPKDSTAIVQLLGEYDPEGQLVIVDPYYGGEDGFEKVFQQVSRCCKAFLEEAMKKS